MTQLDALNLLKTGTNIFITGPAGSGKTYVINEYIKYLKDHDVLIGITASTGIAATHLGGVTIHSWSGMGIKDDLTEHDLETLSERGPLVRRFKETAVLIIDEVSMLHHFRLDILDQIARRLPARPDKPFGGMQVVLCGDFFQLPPVTRAPAWGGSTRMFAGAGEETNFIYRSKAWRDGGFTHCYLHENFRQIDDPILNILNEIRSGEVSHEARNELKSRHVAALSVDPASGLRVLNEQGPGLDDQSAVSSKDGTVVCRLFTHNANVDVVNDAELSKVSGTEYRYEMSSRGKKPLVEALKKSCLAPEVLRLKVGARVMCVKNNFEEGYVNGTLGVVISCPSALGSLTQKEDPRIVIRTAPSRDWPNGRELEIEPASWTIEDDGRVLAEIVQYPLRLAWAITVHKSQGMSLDAVEVDLGRAFEPGMGYVALSRVRTLKGLTILSMNEAAFHVHPEVLEYDRHLRQLSDRAEAVLSGIDEKDLVRAQEEFLAKVAPMHGIGRKGPSFTKATKGKRGEGSKKDRRSTGDKVSTYDRTAVLVHRKKALREMAVEREMTVETIISHIEHLIIRGPDDGGLGQADIAYLKYEISPQHFPKIEKTLEEVAITQADDRPPLLSPIKNKVGPNISFRDIRLARVLLGYVGKGADGGK